MEFESTKKVNKLKTLQKKAQSNLHDFLIHMRLAKPKYYKLLQVFELIDDLKMSSVKDKKEELTTFYKNYIIDKDRSDILTVKFIIDREHNSVTLEKFIQDQSELSKVDVEKREFATITYLMDGIDTVEDFKNKVTEVIKFNIFELKK